MPDKDYIARALSDTWDEAGYYEYPTQEQRDMVAAGIVFAFLRCVPPDVSVGGLLEKVKEIANG